MNFYFEFTTTTYKARHAIAMELGKLFPGSKFAARVGSRDNVSTQFLEKQTDIKYKLYYPRDDEDKAMREDADYKLLKEFEAALPEKSLWRIIAVDREWGHQFVKGVYLPKSYIQTINTHENILKIASGRIKFYRKVLYEFKPDVVIPAVGQNNMMCPILDQMCKRENILYLMPETIRTRNFMALADNRQYTFPQINETCRQLMDKKPEADLSAGKRCYDEIMADLENTKYFDVSRIDHLKSRWPLLKFLYGSSRSLAAEIYRWCKRRALRKKNTAFEEPDGIKTLFYNLCYRVLLHYRRMQLVNPKFYSKFDPSGKYAYFALHNTNEYTTQVQGTMWINQLQIIEALAKSIPFDWKIVVKEHPAMLLYRIRPMSFYKEIKQYSNVLLIPADTSSNAVISNAQLVVTIVGTTGWEAIIRGKPVISFEKNMFDVLKLSGRCSDFKELSVAIHDEVERMKKISRDERKRRILCLLTAIVKHGFWIDNPSKAIHIPCESDEEANKIGKIIAGAIKEYMEYKGIGLGKAADLAEKI